MRPEVDSKLRTRVVTAAETALAHQGYACAIDVLTGIGWLDHAHLRDWTQGRLEYLEQGISTKPTRLAAALEVFRVWAAGKHLEPSETDYVAKSPARTRLRFTASGDSKIELLYRTHWTSRDLPEKKRKKLDAEATRAPELVVVQPVKEWSCHRCSGTGDFLIMEPDGPSCLACAGLGSLVFLPAGDAMVSRRAKANSATHAVVVRFSRSRKRYERQGLLVEPEALRQAERGRAT